MREESSLELSSDSPLLILGPSVVATLVKEVGDKASKLEGKFKSMITGSDVRINS